MSDSLMCRAASAIGIGETFGCNRKNEKIIEEKAQVQWIAKKKEMGLIGEGVFFPLDTYVFYNRLIEGRNQGLVLPCRWEHYKGDKRKPVPDQIVMTYKYWEENGKAKLRCESFEPVK